LFANIPKYLFIAGEHKNSMAISSSETPNPKRRRLIRRMRMRTHLAVIGSIGA